MNSIDRPSELLILACKYANGMISPGTNVQLNNSILSIANFIYRKEGLLVRDFETSDLSYEDTFSYNSINKYLEFYRYIKNNTNSDSLRLLTKNVNIPSNLSSLYLLTRNGINVENELKESLIVIHMVRNAIVHGSYSLESPFTTISINWEYADGLLKVDIPTSMLSDLFGEKSYYVFNAQKYHMLISSSEIDRKNMFQDSSSVDDPEVKDELFNLIGKMNNDPALAFDDQYIASLMSYMDSKVLTIETKDKAFSLYLEIYQLLKDDAKYEETIDSFSNSSRYAFLYNYLALFFSVYDTRSDLSDNNVLLGYSDFSGVSIEPVECELERRRSNLFQGYTDYLRRNTEWWNSMNGVSNDRFEANINNGIDIFVQNNANFGFELLRMIRNAVQHNNVRYEGNFIIFMDNDIKITFMIDDLLQIINQRMSILSYLSNDINSFEAIESSLKSNVHERVMNAIKNNCYIEGITNWLHL